MTLLRRNDDTPPWEHIPPRLLQSSDHQPLTELPHRWYPKRVNGVVQMKRRRPINYCLACFDEWWTGKPEPKTACQTPNTAVRVVIHR